MFLPKQYTDFVFSNFAEEWGFLGSLMLLLCFFLFVLTGLNIAQRAKDKLGCLIAIGVTAYFFWHVIVNIGMELGLLPVVGLPLPFLKLRRFGNPNLIHRRRPPTKRSHPPLPLLTIEATAKGTAYLFTIC